MSKKDKKLYFEDALLNMGRTTTVGYINTSKTIIGGTGAGTIAQNNRWNDPELLEVEEVGETLELIWKQTSNTTLTTFGTYIDKSVRVYKIIYSCIEGKWNKSERIYGKIIPASEEHYEF